MKAQFILIACVLLGVLLGWPAGVMTMRFYLPLYGPHFYRSIDEPRRIFLGFVCGGMTLGALLGALVGWLSIRSGEKRV
jgi:hypothetical protein